MADLWFVRAKNSGQEAVLAKLRPTETLEDADEVMLHLSLAALLYLLFDEEIRKVEP